MTVSFAGVNIPNASKLTPTHPFASKAWLLLSGRYKVTTAVYYGTVHVIEGFGAQSDVDAIMATVGVEGTLVIDSLTITNCYITGTPDIRESDKPGEFYYKITFTQDTA